MGRLACAFGGIGHSYPGLGRDLYEAMPEMRAAFEEVSDYTRLNIEQLCFDGSFASLNRYAEGIYVQLAVSVGCYRIIAARGVKPTFLCGPCGGQLIACAASGCLSIPQVVDLFQSIETATRRSASGLLARIIGLDRPTVEMLCLEANRYGVIDLAVILGPKRFCVSGQPRAVQVALDLARRAGAEEAAPMPVELRPVHSRLLAHLTPALLDIVAAIPPTAPPAPILSSLDGRPKQDTAELLSCFAQEIASVSDWQAAVDWLVGQGVDAFISLGMAWDIVRAANERAVSLHVRDLATLTDTLACLYERNLVG